MTLKPITLLLALFALLTAGVSADDPSNPKGFGVMGTWRSGPVFSLEDPIVLDAVGLEAEELRAALLDGETIGDLIEANDSDVETVIAALATQASEAIQAQAASKVEGLEESFSEALKQTYRRRFPWRRHPHPIRQRFGAWGMDATILQATGLTAAEAQSALYAGSTIADLIEANDGDVTTVVSSLVEQATQGINEAASARAQNHEDNIRADMETDFSDMSGQRGQRPRSRGFFSFWSMRSGPESTAVAEIAETDES